MHNFTYIIENFMEWSLQGYTALLGFLFWPIIFTTISVYVYLKQQSATAWAIAILIFIAVFGNELLGVDPWLNLIYVLVAFSFMGLTLLFITKYRR